MMKINVTLNLPEDFQQVCDIFGFQTEEVLQSFMNDVSFPKFFSEPDNTHRWATLFFLYNMNCSEEIPEEFEQFMDKMTAVIQKDKSKAVSACRKIMKDWHRSAMAKKSSYLLKSLEKEE